MLTNTVDMPKRAIRQLTWTELEAVSGGQSLDPYHMPRLPIGAGAFILGAGAAVGGAATGGGK